MPTQLDRILAHTFIQVNARKQAADYALLESKAAARTPRGFTAALRAAAADGPAVIAEIKKASPSKGVIRAEFYPAKLAIQLQQAGAAALSVLTDEEFFQGSLGALEAASSAVTIPCLRKDFIMDPFQVLEARAYGADAILLIVAAHNDITLRDLHAEAFSLGLDVLCEAHDRDEITRAVDLGFDLIGVNSRDLRSFNVCVDSLIELADLIPPTALRVAESGIRNAEDIARLQSVGYGAFLIGEALMRQPDPGAALALMLDRDYSLDI